MGVIFYSITGLAIVFSFAFLFPYFGGLKDEWKNKKDKLRRLERLMDRNEDNNRKAEHEDFLLKETEAADNMDVNTPIV